MGGPHAAQPGPEPQILTIPWREPQVLDHPAAPHLGQVILNWDTSLECRASAGQEGVLQHVPKLDRQIPQNA